ncbi:MAG: sulfatase-like hydrolase/transferase, partial [Candidatus Sumerlaeota bacterium]
TNNAKTDYNIRVDMDATWNESSNKAHYKNRREGQPFFAVFNTAYSHEAFVHPHKRRDFGADATNPQDVTLPSYHPDTPNFRRDRAQYYDNLNWMDQWVGKMLDELEESGLAENTIVFYYSDHGGVLPRSKRFLFNSGTHAALVIRFPEKYKHLAPAQTGQEVKEPVTFADLGPTVLSLADIETPAFMHGRAFAGAHKASPRKYAYCYRARMDERFDFSRAVKTDRFNYIRNYLPHLIYGQHIEYMFKQESYQEWRELYREGKLNEVQGKFWEPKPAEELYDFVNDPNEVVNLVDDPKYADVLEELRAENKRHMLEIRDCGFVPEDSHYRIQDELDNPDVYNLERYLEMADVVTARDPKQLPQLIKWMGDPDRIVRYWAAMGCLMLGDKAKGAEEALRKALEDPYEIVRLPSAESLFWLGHKDEGRKVLEQYASHKNKLQLWAVNAIDRLGEDGRPSLPVLKQAWNEKWADKQVQKVIRHTFEQLGETIDEDQ